MDSWYAVHTHPNGERKAQFNLQRQGFHVYLPSYFKLRRHARRVEKVLAPLFPRYLFVRMNVDIVPWRSINSTFGVSCLVGDINCPQAVPSGVIEGLQRREDAKGVIQVDVTEQFGPGDKVEIVDGAMTGVLGIFCSVVDNDRVQILLEILGRGVDAFVPKSAIGAPS